MYKGGITMNYNDILIQYIDKCPYDDPIFIEEIKDYFKEIVQDNFENTFKNIYVYINRLVKENKLSQFVKGIYYKPVKGIFGNKPLNINKVIEKNIFVTKMEKRDILLELIYLIR